MESLEESTTDYPDDTSVTRLDPLMQMYPCDFCGALETHVVMGPAALFTALPRSCARHIAKARARARGKG